MTGLPWQLLVELPLLHFPLIEDNKHNLAKSANEANLDYDRIAIGFTLTHFPIIESC